MIEETLPKLVELKGVAKGAIGFVGETVDVGERYKMDDWEAQMKAGPTKPSIDEEIELLINRRTGTDERPSFVGLVKKTDDREWEGSKRST